MNTYRSDYEKSRKVEIEFEKYIKEKYDLQTENSSKMEMFPYWDISTTASTKHKSKVTKFEIKYNSNYKQNTVVIETGKIIDSMFIFSGLNLTNSEYYVIVFPEDSNFYLISVEKLKALVGNNKNRNKTIVFDKNNYQLHIFKKDWFLSQCTII